MGSVSSTYVEPSGTGDPHPDTVDTTRTAEPIIVNRVIVDPPSVAPEDIRIVNWIGQFIKPLEERINTLERQVELLMSLQNQPQVEVRTKTTT